MTPAGPPRVGTPARIPGTWGECHCQALSPPFCPHTPRCPLPAPRAATGVTGPGVSCVCWSVWWLLPLSPPGSRKTALMGGRVQGGVQRPAPPAPGLSAQDQGREDWEVGLSALGAWPLWAQPCEVGHLEAGQCWLWPSWASWGGEQGFPSSASLSLAQGQGSSPPPPEAGTPEISPL